MTKQEWIAKKNPAPPAAPDPNQKVVSATLTVLRTILFVFLGLFVLAAGVWMLLSGLQS